MTKKAGGEAEDINSLMSRIAILHKMIDEFSLLFQGVLGQNT